MDIQQEAIRHLLEKVKNATATAEECDQLLQLVNGDQSAGTIAYINNYYEEQRLSFRQEDDPVWAAVFANVIGIDKEAVTTSALISVPRASILRRYWAAASIFLLLGVGGYLWYQGNNRQQTLISNNGHLPSIIEPGRRGAILTLADGTEVVLDSLGDGVIAMQSGARVTLQNGQLAYDLTKESGTGTVFNAMSTPKGRKFNLQLPDGTRVWLNAASSLRYPTRFSGKERRVEITGEAYFEVAKDTKMPFKVNVNDEAEVEVLGTHFNINAYENEGSVNMTLLEGSIKVKTGRKEEQAGQQAQPEKEVILQPGQQAQVPVGKQTKPEIEVVNKADISKVMAWKNGVFDFNGVGLKEVMRQLERWYDIEVIYESTVPDAKLRGKMTSGVTLNELLKNLGKLGVHCRLEDRKLVVLP